VHGPIFTQILLADEINRTPPKTQAALLEAMQERHVTASGRTWPLEPPFFVLATQNPIEMEGTYPLPEAQLDRFLMRVQMGYPGHEDERQIIRRQQLGHPIDTLASVVDGQELLDLSRQVSQVHVDPSLEDYILRLVQATRTHTDLTLGASPRGSLALYKTSQALAALKNRSYVIPDDIKKLIPLTLAHRLILKPASQLRGRTSLAVLAEITERTELPLDAER
jgi:MoxR-like ATPase